MAGDEHQGSPGIDLRIQRPLALHHHHLRRRAREQPPPRLRRLALAGDHHAGALEGEKGGEGVHRRHTSL